MAQVTRVKCIKSGAGMKKGNYYRQPTDLIPALLGMGVIADPSPQPVMKRKTVKRVSAPVETASVEPAEVREAPKRKRRVKRPDS